MTFKLHRILIIIFLSIISFFALSNEKEISYYIDEVPVKEIDREEIQWNVIPLNIFDLYHFDDYSFISLSELIQRDAPSNQHPEDSFLPEGNKKDSYTYYDQDVYLIKGKQRTLFFKELGIKENDFLFLHNYSTGKTDKKPLSKLELIAKLNIYDEGNSDNLSYYYMFGFKLKSIVPESNQHMFAYIGKENPFTDQPLTLIKWSPISEDEWKQTIKDQNIILTADWMWKSLPSELPFKSINTPYTFYVKRYGDNWYYMKYMMFFIWDTENKTAYNSSIIHSSESAQIAQLNQTVYVDEDGNRYYEYGDNKDNKKVDYIINYQWTGKLFKDLPDVFFGFTSNTFGCPSIDFVEDPYSYIPILCDNRH